MATIRVHTTQNVTLEYEVASIGDRIVATILDNLVLAAWAIAAVLSVTTIAGRSSTISAWIIGILVGIPYVFYNLVCEIWLNGQSLGKKARDLRVMRLDGTSPRLGDYFLRWLLRIIDFGVGSGLVAVITIAINGKGQRLGDLAAGTTVISLKARPEQLPMLTSVQVPPGYQPVFAQAADLTDHDVALLRQLLGRSIKQDNYLLLNETANKIKSLLHLHSDLSDEAFLHTILRDHAYIVAAEH
ncbi:RDD family protein [Hymenobacter sp. BRD67]|uniref:RDD family protein n=1 Tax=Hymenobacter sp. BRD67 TaxID=2675877 RepID=UPI001564416C|nr:RDD family protein [Hymenobacter sp. BRD67]QKG53461.1 RDD family protein [Hymenobacter sp. BRD67]